jgi:hypothetical protein
MYSHLEGRAGYLQGVRRLEHALMTTAVQARNTSLPHHSARYISVIIRIGDPEPNDARSTTVSVRCPACRQIGTFDPIHQILDVWVRGGGHLLGQRVCPNEACRAHIFFVRTGQEISASYPAQRIDFDSTDIPQEIVESFDEALTCHSHACYVAAAIMVRKTLEDICRDRGAAGDNLKNRIKSLGTKVVLPAELLDALDDLRLLGNDAAHVESQTFNDVGEAELNAAIAVTKEVLKAVYQYAALLNQLRALKRP